MSVPSLARDAVWREGGGLEIELRLARSKRTLAAHQNGGGLRHRDRDPHIEAAIAGWASHGDDT